jgi:hypothetical protein
MLWKKNAYSISLYACETVVIYPIKTQAGSIPIKKKRTVSCWTPAEQYILLWCSKVKQGWPKLYLSLPQLKFKCHTNVLSIGCVIMLQNFWINLTFAVTKCQRWMVSAPTSYFRYPVQGLKYLCGFPKSLQGWHALLWHPWAYHEQAALQRGSLVSTKISGVVSSVLIVHLK